MIDTYVSPDNVKLSLEIRKIPEPQTTLVLLHGFTGSAASWDEHLTTFASCGMNVIALDMLGHGRSDAPDNPERYAIEHCREDIISALKKLGVQKGEAILLGYSMGGRIALYTAFSGFFRGLILESASPGLADPVERESRRQSDEALAARIECNGIAKFVDYWENIPLFASQQSLPASVREKVHRQRLQNSVRGLANSLRGVGTGSQPALHDTLSELDIPVLLIAGELDPKFCIIAREMARLLPQAQLAIVPNAGHTVHLEQPGLFDTLVKDFCSQFMFAHATYTKE